MGLFYKPPTSFMGQQPQENQFLQGNPSTQPEANTSWMNPSSSESGWSQTTPSPIPSPSSPSQSAGLVGNGTALSSLVGGGLNPPSYFPNPNAPSSGNTGINGWPSGNPGVVGPDANPGGIAGNMGGNQSVGQGSGMPGKFIPEGYDYNKLTDPSLGADSTKYQVGRILSNFDPNGGLTPEIGQQLQALGISIIGKDTLRLPDGTTVDVGKSFSDPSAKHAWQYNWSGPGGQGGQTGQPTSYMGNNSGQANMMNPQFMNQILFQILQNSQGNKFQPMGNVNRGPGQVGGSGTMQPGMSYLQ